LVDRLQSRLAALGGMQANPFWGSRRAVMLPGDEDRLRALLRVARHATAALREAAAALATYDRALNLLAFRARSSADLRRKLVEKGEPPALADQAIARLTALGLLNDDEYARQVARGRLLGGASKRRVQQELWRRGVARDVADDAVSEVVADEEVDEEDSAARVARRKAASLAKLDAPTRRRRLYGFLARRGYDHAAIRAAMSEVLDAAEVDALDDEEVAEE
jgi:regulatory protein